MAQTNPRQTQFQQVHYFRGQVTFDQDGPITTGILRGTFPAGAILLGTDVSVDTAFNGADGDIFTIGTNSASWNNIVAAGDVNEAATGLTQNIKPTGAALGSLAAAADFYVKLVPSSTAATTGNLWYVIKYAPNNDQGSEAS